MKQFWKHNPKEEIPPNDPFYHLSFPETVPPSFIILKKKSSRALKSMGLGKEIVFPSLGNLEWKKTSSVQDVVLFADAPILLANPHLWPKEGKFRLWTLCQSFAELTSKLTGIPKHFIGVLPREKMVKIPKSMHPFPSASEESTLVVSSRFDSEKNVEFTIKVAHELQKMSHGKIGLVLCSPQKINPSILNTISGLSWIKKPTIAGDLGPQWIDHIDAPHPILIHLSTARVEDFSVSVAQAHEKKWPLILPYWSVFREIHGDSILHLPASVLLKDESQSVDAVVLFAQKIFQRLEGHLSLQKKKTFPNQIPKILSAKKLESYQKTWTEKKAKDLRRAFHQGNYPNQGIAKKVIGVLSREL